MSTEIEPANASLEVPKRNTWNIIFIAVDIIQQDNPFLEGEEDIIEIGISNFKRDVNRAKFSENVSISLLDYTKKQHPVGKAEISFASKGNNGNYKFNSSEEISFNCHTVKSYADYFIGIKSVNRSSKNLIVFLAHSFGAGFLYYKNENATNQNKYFTTVQLNQAISKSFGKVQCFLSVNCTLQSVESNCIFKNSVELLIGSQQELYVETIYYTSLIEDLSNYSFENRKFLNQGMNNENLFTKFILNCHSIYSTKKQKDIKQFCLTLSKPKNAKYFMAYLNAFALSLNKRNGERDFDFIRFSKKYCEDPSSSNLINIIDAQQFFVRLQEYFINNHNTIKASSINYIVAALKKIVVFHLVSGNSCQSETIYGDNLRIYLPNGLGLFLEKVKSGNQRIVLNIYDKFFDSTFRLFPNEWREVITGIDNENALLKSLPPFHEIIQSVKEKAKTNLSGFVKEKISKFFTK